jgi:hypothetical protein
MQPNWQPYIVEFPITVTLDAYEANDVVGGTLTSDAIDQKKGGGYVAWARLVDGATQAEPYRLWLFNEEPSTIADTAAHVPTEADWLKVIGIIDIPAANYNTDGTEADCAFAKGVDIKTNDYIWFDSLPTGKLYARLVANGSTPDYAAAVDLTLHVCVLVM